MADLRSSSADDCRGRPVDAAPLALTSGLSRRGLGRWTLLGASAGLLGLAGCGTSNNTSTPAAGASTTTSASTAAGGSAGPTSSAPKTGSITVQVQATAEKQFAAFIKVFNTQHPGITVKTTSVSQIAKTGSNLTVLTSNGAPDVAIVPTNTEVYSRMLQTNQLVAIDDVWSAAGLEAAYGSSVASSLKSNGKPYVVAYDRTLYNVVYYNKTIFSKLNIATPTDHRIRSLDDFVSLAGKVQKGGYQGLAYGAADGYQSSWQIDSFLQTSASASEYANYLSSWQKSVTPTAKYTDPAFVSALTQLQNMGKAKVYQDGYLGQKVPQSEALFVQGRAAMLLDGNYTVSTLKGDGATFAFDWMLLPPVDSSKKTEISLYTGDTLGIPVKAANPELAKLFLESVMSQAGQISEIQFGQLPAINTVPKASYKGLDPIVQEQVADVAANGAEIGWTSGVPGGFGQQFTDPLVQAMLNGQSTPQDVAAKVQAQLAVTRSGK